MLLLIYSSLLEDSSVVTPAQDIALDIVTQSNLVLRLRIRLKTDIIGGWLSPHERATSRDRLYHYFALNIASGNDVEGIISLRQHLLLQIDLRANIDGRPRLTDTELEEVMQLVVALIEAGEI